MHAQHAFSNIHVRSLNPSLLIARPTIFMYGEKSAQFRCQTKAPALVELEPRGCALRSFSPRKGQSSGAKDALKTTMAWRDPPKRPSPKPMEYGKEHHGARQSRDLQAQHMKNRNKSRNSTTDSGFDFRQYAPHHGQSDYVGRVPLQLFVHISDTLPEARLAGSSRLHTGTCPESIHSHEIGSPRRASDDAFGLVLRVGVCIRSVRYCGRPLNLHSAGIFFRPDTSS